MELFKWLIDIEENYEKLIVEATKESEIQISTLKEELDSKMESIIKGRKNFVDSTLNTLMNELKENITLFKESCENEIKSLEKTYETNRSKLISKIMKKLGYDF